MVWLKKYGSRTNVASWRLGVEDINVQPWHALCSPPPQTLIFPPPAAASSVISALTWNSCVLSLSYRQSLCIIYWWRHNGFICFWKDSRSTVSFVVKFKLLSVWLVFLYTLLLLPLGRLRWSLDLIMLVLIQELWSSLSFYILIYKMRL